MVFSVWWVVSFWFIRINQCVTTTNSRAHGRDVTPRTCRQASGLTWGQVAGDRACVVRVAHCVSLLLLFSCWEMTDGRACSESALFLCNLALLASMHKHFSSLFWETKDQSIWRGATEDGGILYVFCVCVLFAFSITDVAGPSKLKRLLKLS